MASNAYHPKDEPLRAAMRGTIPVRINSVIAMKDPKRPPKPFHRDLA
jgi:hypothetical protein